MDPIQAQEPLEAVLKDEIIRMYEEVAENPEGDFHFYHGREAAEMFGYEPAALEVVPEGAVASFGGVGNPHLRAEFSSGETVLDIGSGAGLDAILAARAVGSNGTVVGVDLNDAMREKAAVNAKEAGVEVDLRSGTMEALPVEDGSVDVVISNGVLNLSFRKRKAIQEIFRVLKPGGRLSITDIVSGKQLSQSIVNDPKLWASWIGGALLEGEMFRLLEETGFQKVKSAVVPGFQFKKGATRNSAESFGVKAVMMTAVKPA